MADKDTKGAVIAPSPLASARPSPLAETAAQLSAPDQGITIGAAALEPFKDRPPMAAMKGDEIVRVKLGKGQHVFGWKSTNPADGKRFYQGGQEALIDRAHYEENPHMGLMWSEEENAWVQLRSAPNTPYNRTPAQEAAVAAQVQRTIRTTPAEEVPADPTGSGNVLRKVGVAEKPAE